MLSVLGHGLSITGRVLLFDRSVLGGAWVEGWIWTIARPMSGGSLGNLSADNHADGDLWEIGTD